MVSRDPFEQRFGRKTDQTPRVWAGLDTEGTDLCQIAPIRRNEKGRTQRIRPFAA